MFVLNSLCMTQFVTSSVAVFEAAIHKSPSKKRFWNQIKSNQFNSGNKAHRTHTHTHMDTHRKHKN